MKLLLNILGAAGEWILTVLWFPVHLRNYLQAKTLLAQAQTAAAHGQDLAANAQVMMALHAMGSDTRPLARHVAGLLHEAYGVRSSSVAPGTVVPISKGGA